MDGGACTLCAYGYRLGDDGYCYKCFNPESGYYECPDKCTMNSTVANTKKNTI